MAHNDKFDLQRFHFEHTLWLNEVIFVGQEVGSSSHLVKVEVWVVILKNGLCLPFAFRARLRTT